jgi:hypothetical protein
MQDSKQIPYVQLRKLARINFVFSSCRPPFILNFLSYQIINQEVKRSFVKNIYTLYIFLIEGIFHLLQKCVKIFLLVLFYKR